MKKLAILGLLNVLILSFGGRAYATESVQRELVCRTATGAQVGLSSNNFFYSQNEDAGLETKLLLDRGNGQGELLSVVHVNDSAKRTRGNAEGKNLYIFASESGEEFFVELEFSIDHGMAGGIKAFNVLSKSFQFEHTQKSLSKGACKVLFL